jgi:hypothetical protein
MQYTEKYSYLQNIEQHILELCCGFFSRSLDEFTSLRDIKFCDGRVVGKITPLTSLRERGVSAA